MSAGKVPAVRQPGKFRVSAGDAQITGARYREVAPGTCAAAAECEHCGAVYTAVSGTREGCRRLMRRKHLKHLPSCAGPVAP